jgi:Fic/DOC family
MPTDDERQDSKEMASRYARFYSLDLPRVPTPQTSQRTKSDSLKYLVKFNKDCVGLDEEAEIRYSQAFNGAFPFTYPDPSELPHLIEGLMEYMTNLTFWFKANADYKEAITDFKSNVVHKIVAIHPFVHGNKRTERMIANAIEIYLNEKNVDECFSPPGRIREKYQIKFSKTILTGDYKLTRKIHELSCLKIVPETEEMLRLGSLGRQFLL